MKSNIQMIKSITFKLVRQKISDVLEPGHTQHIISSVINSMISKELDNMLQQQQAEIMERLAYERKNITVYRNGYKKTRVWGFGKKINLKRPVTRKGTMHFPLLTAFKAAGQYLASAIAGSVWLKGASTRATSETINNTFGIKMSPSDISAITNTLGPLIKQLENRPVPENISYLFLDAFYLPICRHKTSSGNSGFTEKQAMLCAIGIDTEGITHVLGFMLGDRENNDSWGALIDDLLRRGLDRNNLKLVISDEHKAIISSVTNNLGISHQYCLFHKMKNVRLRVAAPNRK